MQKLDLIKVRNNFPALLNGYGFFDNAGGTQVVKQLGEKINDYLYNTNVQLGASYEYSKLSTKRVYEAQKLWSKAINAKSVSEVVLGSSTTSLLQNLSRAMVQQFSEGDEVIVTNCDHEANIGPWKEMKKSGVIVKEWKLNPNSFILDINDLELLISERTKLLSFTHASNILGTINPVKEITKFAHDRDVKVCVDGVAYAPHRQIDVRDLDVDFYVYSLYKVYGPHYSLLYGKRELLADLPGINHFFIGKDETPYKLQPGNVNFELSYGSTAVLDYFDEMYEEHFQEKESKSFNKAKKVFNLIAEHEEDLARVFIEFLKTKKNVQIIGSESFEKEVRVPTISFVIKDRKSSDIPALVDPYHIGIRWGDFYARHLIEYLGLSKQDGVVRVSMVHYNTLDEVNKLIRVLDKII